MNLPSETDQSDDEPVTGVLAAVMGMPPDGKMSSSLYRFYSEHRRYMAFFLFIIDLAVKADKIRTGAAKALISIYDETSSEAEHHRKTLENPNLVFDVLRDFAEVPSRQLLLASVDNFLCYFSEIIQSAISKRPDLLKSGATMRVDELLTFRRRADIVSYLIDKQVNDLSYGGISRMDEYMSDKLGISAFKDETLRAKMIIAIELRNIHTHNRGVVNELFLKRVRDHQDFKFKLGRKRFLNFDELSDLMATMLTVADGIDAAVSEKFGISRRRFSAWQKSEKGSGKGEAKPGGSGE